MSCDYSYINPSYYLCRVPGLIMEGVINSIPRRASKNLEENISKIISSVGESISKAVSNAMGGPNMTAAEVGKKIAQITKDIWKEFSDGVNVNGGSFGEMLDDNFHDFWDKLDLENKAERIGDEFSKAFKKLVEKSDISGGTEKFATEVEKTLEAIRGASYRQMDGIRGDFQQIFANMARDTTLKMIPWIALGTAITVGTPLAVHYGYKKAVHNIGKPKLATETRYVGFYDRSVERLSNTAWDLWESTKTGCWYTLKTAIVAQAVLSGANLANYAVNGTMLPIDQHMELQKMLELAMMSVGPTAAAVKFGSCLFKRWKAKESLDKPVFEKELEETLNEITKATYNLNKNGGFFQNVLLYGPGGTGKTMISKYIAKNSDMNYVMMSGGDLAQYIKRGEHVTELNKLFETMNKSSSPTILFIDEAESLCRDRDMIDKVELIELLNAFLNHTGEQSKKFMLIMATNRAEDLDPAVLTRMDHKLHIAPPKLVERKKIIEQYLPQFFNTQEIGAFFSPSVINDIAEKTEGLVGRTLFKMLNAIKGSKHASSENRLTKDIINKGIQKFVEQEKLLVQLRELKKSKGVIAPAVKPEAVEAEKVETPKAAAPRVRRKRPAGTKVAPSAVKPANYVKVPAPQPMQLSAPAA